MISCRDSNKKNVENVEEVAISEFVNFLDDIKEDYQNGGVQLRIALSKFKERYKAAKLKSTPRLASYLYDLHRDLDPTINIRSGSMIRVQVESVKRRKTEGSGRKKKLSSVIQDKENLDPQMIPSRKERNLAERNII